MATVRVQVNNQDLARTLYADGSKAQQFLDNKAQELANRIRTNAPVSSGHLASTVRVETTTHPDLQLAKPNFTGTTKGRKVVVGHSDAKAIEEGTGPSHESLNGAARPNAPYWPLASEGLIAWALRESPDLVRVNKNGTLNLYLLQKHIHDHGTKPAHMVLRSLRETFPNARNKFARD